MRKCSSPTCVRAGDLQPEENFYISNSTASGYTHYCKACGYKPKPPRPLASLKKPGRSRRALATRPTACSIPNCGNTTRLCLDHDHKTGRIREWICHQCNIALGMVGDSPEKLRSLIAYLDKHHI